MPGAHARDRSGPASSTERKGKIVFLPQSSPSSPIFLHSSYTHHTHSYITSFSHWHCHRLIFFQNTIPSKANKHIANPFSSDHTDNGLRAKPWGYCFPPSSANKKKTDKKCLINVSACHRAKFKYLSSCLLSHINFKVISVWLYVEMEDPSHDKEHQAREREQLCEINLERSLIIQHFGNVWMRQGGPIQTQSVSSRALSALTLSLFTVGLCLGLCHVTLWPRERGLLRLVFKKGNSEVLWVSAQQALVLVGFIIFSAYWHVWLVVSVNLSAVFPHEPPALFNMLHWNFIHLFFLKSRNIKLIHVIWWISTVKLEILQSGVLQLEECDSYETSSSTGLPST